MAFVPLHNHSDYSLLDGASQLPAMVARAQELGMPAIALTDHGVMYGAIELLKLCKGTDLKPIIGNEMYVINGSIDDPQPKKEKRYHLVVLAKNAVGYRNLVKLTSISHLRGMRGRGIFPRLHRQGTAQAIQRRVDHCHGLPRRRDRPGDPAWSTGCGPRCGGLVPGRLR